MAEEHGVASGDEISLVEFKGESTGRKNGESFSPAHEMLETLDSVPVSNELGDSPWEVSKCECNS